MDEEYRKALHAAIREYDALTLQRAEIDERIGRLVEAIGTLTGLCGLNTTLEWGLTDACRIVVRNAGRSLTPTEVRDRLAAIGFDLSRYANQLASIHTVLKRLAQSGEVAMVSRPRGKHAVAWAQPPQIVALRRTEIDALLERTRPAGPSHDQKTPADGKKST